VGLDTQAVAAQAPQEIARTIFSKTAVLTLQGPDGKDVSLASGFVVAP
jgi:hypothetical protein